MFSQSASGQGVLTDAAAYPLWQRMVYGCYTLMEYLAKTLFPYKLSYIYLFPAVIGDPLPAWLLLYPALLIIMFVGFWKHLSHWVLKFGLLFFLIHIAVVLNVIQLSRLSIFGDRYLYVALIGIGFILSYFLVYVYQKVKTSGKIAVCCLFAGYVLYLGTYSNVRVRAWYDTDTLKKEIRDLIKRHEGKNPEVSRVNQYLFPDRQHDGYRISERLCNIDYMSFTSGVNAHLSMQHELYYLYQSYRRKPLRSCESYNNS
jgi:hypothetical protein